MTTIIYNFGQTVGTTKSNTNLFSIQTHASHYSCKLSSFNVVSACLSFQSIFSWQIEQHYLVLGILNCALQQHCLVKHFSLEFINSIVNKTSHEENKQTDMERVTKKNMWSSRITHQSEERSELTACNKIGKGRKKNWNYLPSRTPSWL